VCAIFDNNDADEKEKAKAFLLLVLLLWSWNDEREMKRQACRKAEGGEAIIFFHTIKFLVYAPRGIRNGMHTPTHTHIHTFESHLNRHTTQQGGIKTSRQRRII
jgi:hypothetical protein